MGQKKEQGQRVRHIVPSQEYFTFTPEWDNNQEYEQPITMEIKALDNRSVMSYARQIKRKTLRGGREESNHLAIQKKQFVECVENLQNFWYGKEGDEREVTDIEEFWQICPPDLRLEIMEAMEDISVLSDNEKKHARSGRTSRPEPQRTESHGTSGIVRNALSPGGM